MSSNALLDSEKAFDSRFDLVGPTVDDDIRRAINRYGAQAVKDAVNRQAKPKRGRKAEKDWPEIDKILKADARKWLEGGDPFADRSNYSIAQAYAEEHPGQSHAATQRRIMKKLAEKRAFFTLVNAWTIGETDYPYSACLRALKALCELDRHRVWDSLLEGAEGHVADYERKFGEIPANATMKDVEDGARNALLPTPLANPINTLGGLFGAYRRDQR